MNDNQLLTQLAEANAYREETPLPETIWTRDLALSEIERRMGMEPRESTKQPTITSAPARTGQPTTTSTPTRTEQSTPWWRGPRVALGAGAAIAVVVLAVFAIATLIDSDEPFASGDALSDADSYFEAYNAGDVEAVLALFEPEATFSGNFGAQTRTDWEQLLVWNAAQGITLSSPECTVTAEVLGDSVTVSCPYSHLEVVVQAVDGPPVPIILTLTVTPDGISQWHSIFGQPDFNTVGNPFEGWMQRNHPEDASAVGFGNWTTVEEAKQNGILTAQFADEWAIYLEENGCTYREGC